MPISREPWIKLKIGTAGSDKLAGLPDDSARWGWVKALLAAKTQRRMGVFISRAHLSELLGRQGVYVDDFGRAGLLHVVPVLCTDCARRHVDDNLESGNLVIHDYLAEQRDPTNAERQATWRANHRVDDDGNVTVTVTGNITPPTVTPDPVPPEPEPEASPSVTPPAVTAASPSPDPSTANGDVTPDSPARGMTVTVTETVRERRTKKNVLDEELDRAAEVAVRAAPVVDELDLSDPNRAGRPKASSEPRPLAIPPAIASSTPGWRLPCTNYVAHQQQHRIIDGQAVCPPCEDAAAKAGTFPPANATGEIWVS